MFKVIHPNRWFIWTIALTLMIFIVVWGAVERYAIEQEYSHTGDEIYYSVRLHKRTSQNTVDTSSWKTYRNEQYGFELRFPAFNDAKVEKDKNIFYFSYKSKELGGLYFSTFAITIQDNPRRLDLEKWFNETVDINGMLKRANTYVPVRLSNSFSSLIFRGPVPAEWDGVLGASIITMSTNRKYVITFSLSQDDELYLYGYSTSKDREVFLENIASTLTFFEPKR